MRPSGATATPWSNDSQEILLLTLLLSRYRNFVALFERAAAPTQPSLFALQRSVDPKEGGRR